MKSCMTSSIYLLCIGSSLGFLLLDLTFNRTNILFISLFFLYFRPLQYVSPESYVSSYDCYGDDSSDVADDALDALKYLFLVHFDDQPEDPK